jgi:hypothetical protein
MRLQKEQMEGRLPFVAAMQSSAISSSGAFQKKSKHMFFFVVVDFFEMALLMALIMI